MRSRQRAYPLKDVKLDFLCTVYIIIKFTLDMLYITNWQTADVAAAAAAESRRPEIARGSAECKKNTARICKTTKSHLGDNAKVEQKRPAKLSQFSRVAHTKRAARALVFIGLER
jgi:hypothetical protein